MPKTPKKKNKTTRPYKRRRSKGSRTGRIFALTFGFIVLISLSLYGFYYLKNNTSSDPGGPSASQISGLIGDADDNIAGAFFDLGISLKDVKSKKVYKKEKEGVSWEYKEIRVGVPQGPSEEELKSVFSKYLSKTPALQQKFGSAGNSLTAEIKINDYDTHRITFAFPAQKPAPEKIVKDGAIPEPKSADVGETPDSSKVLPYSTSIRPKVVIIVDDIGVNKKQIDALLELPGPVTFAVLPNLSYSDYAAEMARNEGWEVILHLPMEPKESSGYVAADAGESVLLVGVSKKDILAKLNENLSSVPYVRGVNNHMGSKFMQSEELMKLVLKEIKGKGLFFVDSMTSSDSVGYETAAKMGMKTTKRDLFLDDSSKGSGYVKSQIEKLVKISEKKGYAIGICHPYPDTIKALSEMLPQIKNKVELTTVSNILDDRREVSER
ncbi:MAG: divergent polysaccharide deacetylase family protein [Deltaproteobacteria bacterium]